MVNEFKLAKYYHDASGDRAMNIICYLLGVATCLSYISWGSLLASRPRSWFLRYVKNLAAMKRSELNGYLSM